MTRAQYEILEKAFKIISKFSNTWPRCDKPYITCRMCQAWMMLAWFEDLIAPSRIKFSKKPNRRNQK